MEGVHRSLELGAASCNRYSFVSRIQCVRLIRTSESDGPFISSIELRTLRKGMYAEARPGTMLNLGTRRAVGRNSMAR